jgi:hypothetical protein
MSETREEPKQPRRDEPPLRHRDEPHDPRHDEPRDPKHTHGPQVPGINPQPAGGEPLQPPVPATDEPQKRT